MKTNHFTAITAAVISAVTLVPNPVLAATSAPETIPSVPVGMLSAYPTIVQTGTKPTLTWSILYPSKVADMVEINPPGTLMPQDTVYSNVQMICTNVIACGTRSTISPVTSTPQSAEARVSVDGGSYAQLFYGTQTDVNPAHNLFIKKLVKGQTLDFGGRYVKNGEWSPFYTTRSSNLQVVALVSGEVPPTAFALFRQGFLEANLTPYLNASGRINIGPLSVLIMMELENNDHVDGCFDYQDQVLLVTFGKKHPNNGHGNNLDGVDSSNPGRGHGGPNGEIDPSGGVDDERK